MEAHLCCGDSAKQIASGRLPCEPCAGRARLRARPSLGPLCRRRFGREPVRPSQSRQSGPLAWRTCAPSNGTPSRKPPGQPAFHRLIYGDGSDVPDLTQLIVALPASTRVATFDNRPAPPAMTGRLIRGQRFHRRVQTAFRTGLVTADANTRTHHEPAHWPTPRRSPAHPAVAGHLDHYVDNLLQRRQSGRSESDGG